MKAIAPVLKEHDRRPVGRLAYWLRALGEAEMPETIEAAGRSFRRVETIKHDFFAATGVYRDESGERVVLKLGRTAAFAGVPLQWLGQILTERELWFYQRLADLPSVPKVVGRFGPTGMVRRYVTGRPIEKGKPLPDGFFDELDQAFDAVHQRQVAYVDTNKPQNILLGEDGHPYLIDFQISFAVKGRGNFLTRWVLQRFQREDRYHILKHKRRMRPDLMTPQEREQSEKRSWLIRLHRFITRPYFWVRRWIFKRLRKAGQLLPSGSE